MATILNTQCINIQGGQTTTDRSLLFHNHFPVLNDGSSLLKSLHQAQSTNKPYLYGQISVNFPQFIWLRQSMEST